MLGLPAPGVDVRLQPLNGVLDDAEPRGQAPAGVVDQQPSHLSARRCEQIGSVAETRLALQEQANDRFVGQGRRLERMALPLASHEVAGDRTQRRIDGLQQAIQRVGFAPVRGIEQSGDFNAPAIGGLQAPSCT